MNLAALGMRSWNFTAILWSHAVSGRIAWTSIHIWRCRRTTRRKRNTLLWTRLIHIIFHLRPANQCTNFIIRCIATFSTMPNFSATLHAADVLFAIAVFICLLHVTIDETINRRHGASAALTSLAVCALLGHVAANFAARLVLAWANRTHTRLLVSLFHFRRRP